MRSTLIRRTAAVVAGLAAALSGAAAASAATSQPASGGHGHQKGIQHVLLISVDGLHQQDLTWYVQNNPSSLLATLYRQGVEYSNAQTPFPSDRDVPILVVLPGLKNGRVIEAPVETIQIAPTILSLLGLSPKELQAVRIEGTKVLPSLGNNGH